MELMNNNCNNIAINKLRDLIESHRLKNTVTGIEGIFVREFRNYYGDAIEVRTDSGKHYYAPKHEWKFI